MSKLITEFLISAVFLLCQFHLSTLSNVTYATNTPNHNTFTKLTNNTKNSISINSITKLTNNTKPTISINTIYKSKTNSSHEILVDSEKLTNQTGGLMIFDFRKIDYLDDWSENFGEVDKTSMTKWMFKYRPPRQRALLYTRLEPDHDQFGTAAKVSLNLKNYQKIIMYGKAIGSFSGYKVVLRHEGKHGPDHPAYEQEFIGEPKDHLIILHLSQFKPMYSGYFVHDAPPLNTKNITQMEILVQRDIGGEKKHDQASRLELEWIKAMKKKKEIKFFRKKHNNKLWEFTKNKKNKKGT